MMAVTTGISKAGSGFLTFLFPLPCHRFFQGLESVHFVFARRRNQPSRVSTNKYPSDTSSSKISSSAGCRLQAKPFHAQFLRPSHHASHTSHLTHMLPAPQTSTQCSSRPHLYPIRPSRCRLFPRCIVKKSVKSCPVGLACASFVSLRDPLRSPSTPSPFLPPATSLFIYLFFILFFSGRIPRRGWIQVPIS